MIDILNKFNIKILDKNKTIKENIPNDFTELQKNIIASRLSATDNILEVINNDFDFKNKIYELTDLKKAGDIIANHIKNKSHILIVTDYDADGVNSALILYKTFYKIFNMIPKDNLFLLINKRKLGNGINEKILKDILYLHEKHKIDLIVLADHGSSDEKAFKVIKEHNIDIVLTDHHQIPEHNYPSSPDAFVNPQRTDSHFSKNISGCFTAFITMLSTYDSYYGKLDMDKFNFLLPYVALTTISDVMSLDDPVNRYIMNKGLKELNSFRNPVWKVLYSKLRLSNIISAKDISFKIAPLINTANRTDNEYEAFKLLNSETEEEAAVHYKRLTELSDYRKSTQKILMDKSYEQVRDYVYKHTIVLLLESDLAVNGIVAGRIGEEYKKPIVCFISNENAEILTGSARTIIDGLDIVEIFHLIDNEDKNIFIKFGGHTKAGGCSIHKNKLEDFKRLFDKYAEIKLKDLPPKIEYVDDIIDINKITPSFAQELNRLEPYGENWAHPKFASMIKIKYIRIFGELIRLGIVTSSGRIIEGVYFNNPSSNIGVLDLEQIKDNNKSILAVYNPSMNGFGGVTNLQIKIQSLYDIDKD